MLKGGLVFIWELDMNLAFTLLSNYKDLKIGFQGENSKKEKVVFNMAAKNTCFSYFSQSLSTNSVF